MRSSREPTPQTLQTEKIVSVHVAIFLLGPGKVEVNSQTSQSRPCTVGRASLQPFLQLEYISKDVKLIFEDSATLQSNGSFHKIFRPPLPALSPTGI